MAHRARRKIATTLAELGHIGEPALPDVSTKELAQRYIGIDVEELQASKDRFLEELVPQWLQEAAARNERWDIRRRENPTNYINP